MADTIFWEFTGETKSVFGVTLKQIRAVRDFGLAAKGETGGWISDAVELAQNGRAWVGRKADVLDGVIEGGVVWGGVVEGGVIKGGVVEGGRIKGGVIKGGVIWGGVIWGGTIEGGTIEGGSIRGGVIKGGAVWGGSIWGGIIRGGLIRGGIIEGGVIRGGTIWGGIIKGGTIWGGDFLTISPVGSEGGQFTAEITDAGEIICNRGCWSGTLEEFEASVAKTHGKNEHAKAYASVIDLVRMRLGPIAAERAKKYQGPNQ